MYSLYAIYGNYQDEYIHDSSRITDGPFEWWHTSVFLIQTMHLELNKHVNHTKTNVWWGYIYNIGSSTVDKSLPGLWSRQ